MKKLILILALFLIPSISADIAYVELWDENLKGTETTLEWGVREGNTFRLLESCPAEKVAISADGLKIVKSCEFHKEDVGSGRIAARAGGYESNVNIISGEGICETAIENCADDEDCACPDGYFCYLDGSFSEYSWQEMEADIEASGLAPGNYDEKIRQGACLIRLRRSTEAEQIIFRKNPDAQNVTVHGTPFGMKNVRQKSVDLWGSVSSQTDCALPVTKMCHARISGEETA